MVCDGGGYFLPNLAVISGQDVLNPASSASYSIDRAGLHNAVGMNITRCLSFARGDV